MKEEQLLTYLKANCTGRGNIQSRNQLQRKLNISKDQLTNLVHRLCWDDEPEQPPGPTMDAPC